MARNTFYNTRDSIIYKVYDDIKGIKFGDNKVSAGVSQPLVDGFIKTNLSKQRILSEKEMSAIGYPSIDNIALKEKETYNECGAKWFVKHPVVPDKKMVWASCTNAAQVYQALERNEPMIIKLTGKEYSLNPAIFDLTERPFYE